MGSRAPFYNLTTPTAEPFRARPSNQMLSRGGAQLHARPVPRKRETGEANLYADVMDRACGSGNPPMQIGA